MKTHQLSIKAIGFALSLHMAFADILFAAPADLFVSAPSTSVQMPAPSTFEAPLDYSVLKEIHTGKEKTFLIHIQDAHVNLSGQQNLASTLDELMKKYPISLVLVEGGTRDDSLTALKKLASPEVWKRVAKKFLMEGKISGEEYLNLTSDHPMKIMGIEDKKLYEKSLEAYATLAQKRENILAQIRRVQIGLEKIKKKVYPSALWEYEKLRSKNTDESESFEKKFQALASLAQSNDESAVLLDSFQNVRMLLDIQAEENTIDFKLANLEQAALIEAVSKNGGRERLKEELSKVNSLKNSKVSQYNFIKTLFNTARDRGISMEKYPNLVLYRDNLKRFSELDLEKFLEESEGLEDHVYRDLLPAEDGRLVRSIDRYIALLETAYRIQMTTKEFESFKINEPDFATVPYLAFINRKLADLGYFSDLIPESPIFEDAKSALVSFYESVSDRDQAFIENTQKILANEKLEVAVLIAGGYHTSNLKKLFREKDYSYAVLSPMITTETNQSKYEKILLDDGPAPAGLESDLLSVKRRNETMRPRELAEHGARLSELLASLPSASDVSAEKLAESALNVLRPGADGARLSIRPTRSAREVKLTPAKLADYARHYVYMRFIAWMDQWRSPSEKISAIEQKMGGLIGKMIGPEAKVAIVGYGKVENEQLTRQIIGSGAWIDLFEIDQKKAAAMNAYRERLPDWDNPRLRVRKPGVDGDFTDRAATGLEESSLDVVTLVSILSDYALNEGMKAPDLNETPAGRILNEALRVLKNGGILFVGRYNSAVRMNSYLREKEDTETYLSLLRNKGIGLERLLSLEEPESALSHHVDAYRITKPRISGARLTQTAFFKSGDQIDEYTVVRFIQQGAGGSVYEVKDDQGTPYALKIAIPERGLATDSEWKGEISEAGRMIGLETDLLEKISKKEDLRPVKRYFPEFITRGRFKSSNGDIGNVPYFLMTYIQGETTEQFFNRRFPDRGVSRELVRVSSEVMIELLTALEVLHREGMIHGDLKADNIMIREVGNSLQVTLIDVGAGVSSFSTRQNDIADVGETMFEYLTGIYPDGRKDIRDYTIPDSTKVSRKVSGDYKKLLEIAFFAHEGMYDDMGQMKSAIKKILQGARLSKNGSSTLFERARNWWETLQARGRLRFKVGDAIGPSWDRQRYFVTMVLPDGGMSGIYLARGNDGQEYVIKTNIPYELTRMKNVERRLETFDSLKQEAARLKSLPERAKNVGISKEELERYFPIFVEYGEYNEALNYIVMKPIPGVSADTLVRETQDEKALPAEDVMQLVGEFLKTLNYYHLMGYLHDDIKPANFMVDKKDGQYSAVLIDHGSASAVEGLGGKARVPKGLDLTIAYLSPEEISQGDIDARSDIYKLGLVALEFLTYDHKDFYANSAPSGILEYAQSIPESPLKAVIVRALQVKPEDRYQSADEMLQAWVEASKSLGKSSGARLALQSGSVKYSWEELRERYESFSPDKAQTPEFQKLYREVEAFYLPKSFKDVEIRRELFDEAVRLVWILMEWNHGTGRAENPVDLDLLAAAFYYPAAGTRDLALKIPKEYQQMHQRVNSVLDMPFFPNYADNRTLPNFMNMIMEKAGDYHTYTLVVAVKLLSFIRHAEGMAYGENASLSPEDPYVKELVHVYSTMSNRSNYSDVASTILDEVYQWLYPEEYYKVVHEKIGLLIPPNSAELRAELQSIEERKTEGDRMDRVNSSLSDLSQKVDAQFEENIMSVLATEWTLEGASMPFRVKSNASVFEKIAIRRVAEHKNVAQLTDLLGFFVIVDPKKLDAISHRLSETDFYSRWSDTTGLWIQNLKIESKVEGRIHYDLQIHPFGVDDGRELGMEVILTTVQGYRDYHLGSARQREGDWNFIRPHFWYALIRTPFAKDLDVRFRPVSAFTGDVIKDYQTRLRASRDRTYVPVYGEDKKGSSQMRVLELAREATLADVLILLDRSPADVEISFLGPSGKQVTESLSSYRLGRAVSEFKKLEFYNAKRSKLNQTFKAWFKTAKARPNFLAADPRMAVTAYRLYKMISENQINGKKAKSENVAFSINKENLLQLVHGAKFDKNELETYAQDKGFASFDELYQAIRSGRVSMETFHTEFSEYSQNHGIKLPKLTIDELKTKISGARLADDSQRLFIDEFSGILKRLTATSGVYPGDLAMRGFGKRALFFRKIYTNEWNKVQDLLREGKFGAEDRAFVERAYMIAFIAHELYPLQGENRYRRIRAKKVPYIVHPVNAAEILLREFAPLSDDPDVRVDALAIAAALLHDTLEDTKLALLDNESFEALIHTDDDRAQVLRRMVQILTKQKTDNVSHYLYSIIESINDQPEGRAFLNRYHQILLIKLADKLSSTLLDYSLVKESDLDRDTAMRTLRFLETRREFTKHFVNFLYRTNQPVLRKISLYWINRFFDIQKLQEARIQRLYHAEFIRRNKEVLDGRLAPSHVSMAPDQTRPIYYTVGPRGREAYEILESWKVPADKLRSNFDDFWEILRASFPPVWRKDWLKSPEYTQQMLDTSKDYPSNNPLVGAEPLVAVLAFDYGQGGYEKVIGGYLYNRETNVIETIAVEPGKRGYGATHALLEHMRSTYLQGKNTVRIQTLPAVSGEKPDSEGYFEIPVGSIEDVLNIGKTIRLDSNGMAVDSPGARLSVAMGEKMGEVQFGISEINQYLQVAGPKTAIAKGRMLDMIKDRVDTILEVLAKRIQASYPSDATMITAHESQVGYWLRQIASYAIENSIDSYLQQRELGETVDVLKVEFYLFENPEQPDNIYLRILSNGMNLERAEDTIDKRTKGTQRLGGLNIGLDGIREAAEMLGTDPSLLKNELLLRDRLAEVGDQNGALIEIPLSKSRLATLNADKAGARLAKNIPQPLAEELQKFGITLSGDWAVRPRESQGWSMNELRPSESKPIITSLAAMPTAKMPYPLEDLPILSKEGTSSPIVYLGLAEVEGKLRPAAVKRFSFAPNAEYAVQKALIYAQVRDHLGIGPKVYGVLRDSHNKVVGYAMEIVLGGFVKSDEDEFKKDSRREGFDGSIVRERLNRVGMKPGTDYIKTPQGRYVAIDEDMTVIDKELFNEYLEKSNKRGSRLADEGAGPIRFSEFYGARLTTVVVVSPKGLFAIPYLEPGGISFVDAEWVSKLEKEFRDESRMSETVPSVQILTLSENEIREQLALENRQVRIFGKALVELGISSDSLEGVIGIDLSKFNPESVKILALALREFKAKYPRVDYFFEGLVPPALGTFQTSQEVWDKAGEKRILLTGPESLVDGIGYVAIDKTKEGQTHPSRPMLGYANLLLGIRNTQNPSAAQVNPSVIAEVERMAGNPSGSQLSSRDILGFALGWVTPEFRLKAETFMVRAVQFVEAVLKDYLVNLQAVGQSA